MKGRYVGDAGAYAAYPFTPLVDPLCAAVMLPNVYNDRRRPLRGRRGVHEQVPFGRLPGRRLDERPDGSRGCSSTRSPESSGIDPMELRLKNTIPDGSRTSRRRAASTTAAATPRRSARRWSSWTTTASASASATARDGGPLPRRRLQPVPRAGRLVRRARQAHGLSRSTTWTRPGSRSSRTGRSSSRSACTRTARRTRRRWPRSSPTSSASRSRASRSSRGTRPRPRTARGRSAAAAP